MQNSAHVFGGSIMHQQRKLSTGILSEIFGGYYGNENDLHLNLLTPKLFSYPSEASNKL